MKTLTNVGLTILLLILAPIAGQSQATTTNNKPVVVTITGVRFSYPLLQRWIDEYNTVNPQVQIIIESRGTSDPSRYDILAEAYEQDEEFRKNRQYLYVARYAILPVANSSSAFAKTYASKGLNQNLINQLYFHDLFAEKKKEQEIKSPYTIYTRLQKAGIPIVFTKYFGYEQKDIVGKAIAGSDEHLLKAILRDSLAVSYLPLTLIYDRSTRKPVPGIDVLPVDFNGNGKVSDEEKFYGNLDEVTQRLEGTSPKLINNIAIGYLHLSVSKENPSQEAVAFLRWIMTNGQDRLHEFGYLNVSTENGKVEQFTSKAPGKK